MTQDHLMVTREGVPVENRVSNQTEIQQKDEKKSDSNGDKTGGTGGKHHLKKI